MVETFSNICTWKGGNANEAEHYKPFFAESDVIGFDYQAQNPWEAQRNFPPFLNCIVRV